MTANQGIPLAAPAAIEIRRRPCCPVDVATHTVAVFRAGGGACRRAQRLRRARGQGHEGGEVGWRMHWFD